MNLVILFVGFTEHWSAPILNYSFFLALKIICLSTNIFKVEIKEEIFTFASLVQCPRVPSSTPRLLLDASLQLPRLIESGHITLLHAWESFNLAHWHHARNVKWSHDTKQNCMLFVPLLAGLFK